MLALLLPHRQYPRRRLPVQPALLEVNPELVLRGECCGLLVLSTLPLLALPRRPLALLARLIQLLLEPHRLLQEALAIPARKGVSVVLSAPPLNLKDIPLCAEH